MMRWYGHDFKCSYFYLLYSQGQLAAIKEYSNLDTEQHYVKERTITVIHGVNLVELNVINFVAVSVAEAEQWGSALYQCTNNLLKLCAPPLDFLECFYTQIYVQQNQDGEIPAKLLVRQFVSSRDDKKRAHDTLQSVGLASGGKKDTIKATDFTFEKFLAFYNRLVTRHDIDTVFVELGAKKKPYLTTEQLVSFLNNRQRDPRLNEILFPYYNKERAEAFIHEHEGNKGFANQGYISIDGLTNFLMSADNHVLFQSKLNIHQDMTFPITHYFINSSHNTYLTGHQLHGKSSVEIYRQILLTGCRCIELDCWDGRTEEQEPVITHGLTLCTEILFKDVIEAIKESAFKTTDYPLILSFENHCSAKQQLKMATYCVTIFGDLLMDKTLEEYPLDAGVPLPSPKALKRKILIKNKKRAIKEIKRSASGADQYPSASLTQDSPLLEDVPEVVTDIDVDVDVEGEAEEIKEPIVKTEEDETIAEVEAQQELSNLVNYFQPVTFRGFEHAEKVRKCYEMSSFTENAAFNYLKEQPVDFVNYNKFQPSRIYPKGSRVGSDNYMPQLFWNAGCQFVALNFQTLDLPMMLNLGKFEMNGRCGFLLKPEHMRRTDQTFDPFVESIVSGIIAGTVTVKVISAQCLSERRVSTYVEVEMYGLPADTVRRKYRTKTIPNNGLNPIYEEDVFSFKVILPSLAELRLAVYEDNGRLIGHRILPVDGLSPGYRHIKLRNEAYQPLLLPTVFVDIVTKDYVPDMFQEFADALQNPKKYLSEQDKREEQMKVLFGDDDEEPSTDTTDTVPAPKPAVKTEPTKKTQATPQPEEKDKPKPKAQTLPAQTKRPDKKEIERAGILDENPPDLDVLMRHKGYLKLQSKHDSEMQSLVQKQSKERVAMNKEITKKRNSKKGNGSTASVGEEMLNSQQTEKIKEQFKVYYQEQLELAKSQVEAKVSELAKVLEIIKSKEEKKLQDHHEKMIVDLKKEQDKQIREKLKQLTKDIKDKPEMQKAKRAANKTHIERVVKMRQEMKDRQEKDEEQLSKRYDVRVILEGKAKKDMEELDKLHGDKMAALESDDLQKIIPILLPKKEKSNSLTGRSSSVS